VTNELSSLTQVKWLIVGCGWSTTC